MARTTNPVHRPADGPEIFDRQCGTHDSPRSLPATYPHFTAPSGTSTARTLTPLSDHPTMGVEKYDEGKIWTICKVPDRFRLMCWG